MKVLRTPDEYFEGLGDYPFAPNYTTVQSDDETDVRIHHLDEGPKGGPLILCMQAQAKAWAFYESFEKPFLCAFADDDPVTRGGDAAFIERVPGAQGQPHTTITGGGHFVQENRPVEVVEVIVDFVRSTPVEQQPVREQQS